MSTEPPAAGTPRQPGKQRLNQRLDFGQANSAGADAQNPILVHVPVSTLKVGMSVDSVYVLSNSEQRARRSGEPFYNLTLADATGSIGGVMWDKYEPIARGDIAREDFVRVLGEVGEFNNQPQLTLRRIGRVEDSQVDEKLFIATSPRPRPEMEAELDAIIDGIKNADCKRLLVKMLRHPKMRELYCTAPAAARLHQAYVSGLIEHTLVVVGHALAAAPRYDSVDMDVLATGALLHDIGKVREYSWRRTIGYTDEGRLIGHVTLGGMMVDTAIRELAREPEGFSDRVRQHVLHLVMSHHGKMEWGAPVAPKTREAMLLHFADHMDAFMVIATDAMKIAAAKGERWTNFQKMFDSYLYAETPGDPAAAILPPVQAPTSGDGHPDDVARQTSDSLWIPS